MYIDKRYSNTDFIEILKASKFDIWRPTDSWNHTAKLSFVSSLKEVDYAKFREGFHLVNHIPTRLDPSHPKSFLKLIENAKISMKWGLIDPIDLEEQAFVEGYVLGNIGDVWRFINWENSGVWRICTNKPGQKIQIKPIL